MGPVAASDPDSAGPSRGWSTPSVAGLCSNLALHAVSESGACAEAGYTGRPSPAASPPRTSHALHVLVGVSRTRRSPLFKIEMHAAEASRSKPSQHQRDPGTAKGAAAFKVLCRAGHTGLARIRMHRMRLEGAFPSSPRPSPLSRQRSSWVFSVRVQQARTVPMPTSRCFATETR
jgi:hypothetical protein